MNNETTIPFEVRLQVLGRILDRHPGLVKEVCILQAGEGFVVNMLAATDGVSGPAFVPITRVIEEDEFQTTFREVNGRSWWRR